MMPVHVTRTAADTSTYHNTLLHAVSHAGQSAAWLFTIGFLAFLYILLRTHVTCGTRCCCSWAMMHLGTYCLLPHFPCSPPCAWFLPRLCTNAY